MEKNGGDLQVFLNNSLSASLFVIYGELWSGQIAGPRSLIGI